jgi:hypothetical protein
MGVDFVSVDVLGQSFVDRLVESGQQLGQSLARRRTSMAKLLYRSVAVATQPMDHRSRTHLALAKDTPETRAVMNRGSFAFWDAVRAGSCALGRRCGSGPPQRICEGSRHFQKSLLHHALPRNAPEKFLQTRAILNDSS